MGREARGALSGHRPPATDSPGEDRDLVEAARSGDREAFRHLVDRYNVLLFSVAYSRTGSPSLSEDIAQESFIAAWKQLGQLRNPAQFRTWICTIARCKSARLGEAERSLVLAAAETATVFSANVPSPEESPLDRIITREQEEWIWGILRRLPQRYRVPIVLYYQQGSSVEAVAKALGLSVDNAKQRLARGRRMLHAR